MKIAHAHARHIAPTDSESQHVLSFQEARAEAVLDTIADAEEGRREACDLSKGY